MRCLKSLLAFRGSDANLGSAVGKYANVSMMVIIQYDSEFVIVPVRD